MAFPMLQGPMGPESPEVQFKRVLVTPGIDSGGKGNIDDSLRWQRQHLLSLVKSYHVQSGAVLGHAKPGVLPLLAEQTNRGGQLHGLGTE